MTLKGVDEFNAALLRFATVTVPKLSHEKFKRAGVELLNRTVGRSPVRLGYLRGGWQITINSQPSPIDRADKDGGTTLAEETPKIESCPFGCIIYMTNLVEYAEFVEWGTENQPAQLMMTSAFEEVTVMFA